MGCRCCISCVTLTSHSVCFRRVDVRKVFLRRLEQSNHHVPWVALPTLVTSQNAVCAEGPLVSFLEASPNIMGYHQRQVYRTIGDSRYAVLRVQNMSRALCEP